MTTRLRASAITLAILAANNSRLFGADLWKSAVNGQWDVAGNWTAGLPNANTDVLINATGAAYSVNFTPFVTTRQAKSVTIASSDATLFVDTNITLLTPLLDIQSGNVTIEGSLSGARIQGAGNIVFASVSASSNLTLATTALFGSSETLAGSFALDSGTMILGDNAGNSGQVQLTAAT